ncbi:MAG: hypothetical protein JST23_03255 [Bacteroidetes bacterium]|nr:hypothetical protein [Bacteroidota bacterium]
MKKLFIIAFIHIGFNAFAKQRGIVSDAVKFPTDTTVLPQILALPLNNYIGKPVDSLFSVLPVGYTSRGMMTTRVGYAKGVYQTYYTAETNNCYIEIFIDTIQYLPKPNYSHIWDMNLVKMETIAFIKVWKNNNICLYGCNNPNYYD